MNNILICLLLCISVSLKAQVMIIGDIKSLNGNKIEYVNIGIPGKSRGTVSDKDGHFSIQISASEKTDTLVFRHINYLAKSISIKDLMSSKMNEIVLADKENTLSEVIVHSRKIKKTWINKGMRMPGYAEPNILGEEFGTFINVSKFNGITKCRFNVISCNYDSVIFRFNVAPSEKTAPIYSKCITVYKDTKKRTYETAMSIPLIEQKEIFVSLEYVYSYGTGGIKIPIYFGNAYSRNTSLDSFTKLPVRLGFAIETIK